MFAYFASGRGVDYIYHMVLEPMFKEHEPAIDSFIANLKSRAGEGAKGGIGWVWEYVRNLLGVSALQSQKAAACLRWPLSLAALLRRSSC